MNSPAPVVVLRVAPTSRVRPERLAELERVIGSLPLIATTAERAPETIIEEALQLKASVIVLDSPGTIVGDVVRLASTRNVAVVVAANVEMRAEEHGRGTVPIFHGYERVSEDGELSVLTDGSLADEIGRLRGND